MLSDLRIALRRLWSHPTFALTAVGTLAVGVGAVTAIFSTVNATLLRPLAYPGSDDIYTLNTELVDGRWSSGRVAPAYVAAVNDAAPSVLQAVAVFNREDVLAAPSGENRQVLVHLVTDGFFELVGLPMVAGRPLTAEEYRTGAAVISERIWDEVLGRDPSVIGRTLPLATVRVPVVGVVPATLDLPVGTDVWIGLAVAPDSVAHSFQGYLRARPGTDPDRLRGELATVMAGLADQYPQAASGRRFVVRPLVTALVGDLGPILIVVLAGAVALLLLGAVNVATLVLARGAARLRETAVQAALGAGPWRIVRGCLAHSTVLAVLGTALGVALAVAGVRVLLLAGAAALPRLDAVPFDLRVLAVAVVALAASALLVGLLPAGRLATPDIRAVLQETGRSVDGARGTRRLLSSLVVLEVALAIALVTATGWLVRSYANLVRTEPGFVSHGRLVFTALLAGSRWTPPPLVIEGPNGPMLDPDHRPTRSPRIWLDAVRERLAGVEGIGAVGSTNTLPLGTDWDAAYYVSARGAAYDAERQDTASRRLVSPEFFEAIGTKLTAGRAFRGTEPGPVAIVNEAFVRRYLPSETPVGAAFAWGFPLVDFDRTMTIVGVVEDVKYRSLREAADPIFYLPVDTARQTVVVETTVDDPAALVPAVRAAIAEVDPAVPVEIAPLETLIGAELTRHRLGLVLMTLFGLMSLLLAVVGIYGVTADAVQQRSGEFATRVAFGARPADIRRLVLRQGVRLVAGGTVLGLGLAVVGGRFATSRLFEVRATDPVVLVIAVALVCVLALLAYLPPAIRASRITPRPGLLDG